MSNRANLLRIAGLTIGGLVTAGASAVVIGGLIWRRETSRQVDRLDEESRRQVSNMSRPFSRAELANLPAPVARYLTLAIPEGQRRIRAASISWTGAMRLEPDADWSPFTADQHFTIRPAGFVWNAQLRMLPLIPVLVRDSYVAGTGQMLGRIGGLATVVNEGGTPEMAQGELARWLGEAAWFPTAFLPGDGVTWEAVDDSTARATVTHGTVQVSGTFQFASTGELERMSAMRYRNVNGRDELTPFEGRYSGTERRDGLMVPASAEVAWLAADGRFAYWRGKPVMVRYEFSYIGSG